MNTCSRADRAALWTLGARLVVLAIVAILAFAPAATTHALQPAAGGTMQDFESTLAPWTPVGDHELADAWSIDRPYGTSVACGPAMDGGERHAALAGRIVPALGQAYWLVSGFPADGLVEVKVSFFARSTIGCAGNCAVVATVARRPPYDGNVFTHLGAATKDWQYYQYSRTLLAEGTVYAALGWGNLLSPTDIPVPRAVAYDCVNVTVTSLTDSAR